MSDIPVLRSIARRTTALIGLLGLAAGSALLQPEPGRAQSEPTRALEGSSSAFNLTAVNSLLNRGDAAAASGNLSEARRLYDQARDAARRLLAFYRDLSGSFRGLDARIPRDMDSRGRDALDAMAKANLRLAAVFRRQNQPEVAVPLLVEVVKVMTPANEDGRKAYQQLVELGFVSIPYTAPSSTSP
jgi:ATP/maltotriose-dependent transcriptional regulator MalT